MLALLASVAAVGNFDRAAAGHRTQWLVYPVVFYGSDQTYGPNWRTYGEAMLRRVKNWYQQEIGETFTIGTWMTRQGQNGWDITLKIRTGSSLLS